MFWQNPINLATTASATREIEVAIGEVPGVWAVGEATMQGVLSDSFGSGFVGGLTKTGGGVLHLSAANTYRGVTRAADGRLNVATENALQFSTLDMAAADTGTMTFAQDSTLGGLSGSRSLNMGGRRLSIGNNDANTTYSGVLSNGGLTKVGSGRLTLSAASTYTGATTISAGVLEVGPTGRIDTTSEITLNGSTAELRYNADAPLSQPITFTQGTISGTGTIATDVTVAANDVISPGNSPGIQAYTSLHSWAPGGTYEWELNALSGSAGVNWDLVNVTSGTFSLSGLSATPGNQFMLDLITLGLDNAAGQLAIPYAGGSFTFGIASYNPANLLLPAGFSNTAGADLTSLFTIGLDNWLGTKPQVADISVRINSGADGIDLVIVPEPGAIALAGLGIAAACALRRRRS